MRVFGLAFVFADVVVAEEAIAAIAPGVNRVMALGCPIFVMEMVRDTGVAGGMLRSMHDDSTAKRAKSIARKDGDQSYSLSKNRLTSIDRLPRLSIYLSSGG